MEESKKQDKPFCLGMRSGAANTFSAMVVAGQSVGQWQSWKDTHRSQKRLRGKMENLIMANNIKGGSCKQ